MFHTAISRNDQHRDPDKPLDSRTRDGLRAVGLSLAVLVATAVAQALVFVASESAALLADLIHNVGDALTAVPVGLAFLLRSERAERLSGLAVVFAIFVSGVVAGVVAVDKLINRETPDHLLALALAGMVGVIGNSIAARIRSHAGKKLDSPALVADGHHAKVDALVSGGVVLSSIFVGLGLPIADPLIALVITAMIGHIVLDAWATVHRPDHGHDD
jgi:cation diffusion facilitator family transporter